MKKILGALVAIFAVANVALAKNPVVVTSGSLGELKDSKAKMFVIYDYSKETLEGKSMTEFVAAKENRSIAKVEVERKSAEKLFAETMDKVSANGITIANEESQADYVLTIHFSNLSYGSASASLIIGFGAGNAHMSGTATITKKGNTIAELSFKKLAIDGFDSKDDIRRWGYALLANDIDRVIKKSK